MWAFILLFLVLCIELGSALCIFILSQFHSRVEVKALVTRCFTCTNRIFVYFRFESSFTIFIVLFFLNLLCFFELHGRSNFLLLEHVFNNSDCCFLTGFFHFVFLSLLISQSFALLWDQRDTAVCRFFRFWATSLCSHLAVIRRLLFVGVEAQELIVNLHLSTLSNCKLTFFVENYLLADSFLSIFRLCINFFFREIDTSYDLKDVLEIVFVHSTILFTVHHLPKVLKQCIIGLFRSDILWKESKCCHDWTRLFKCNTITLCPVLSLFHICQHLVEIFVELFSSHLLSHWFVLVLVGIKSFFLFFLQSCLLLCFLFDFLEVLDVHFNSWIIKISFAWRFWIV